MTEITNAPTLPGDEPFAALVGIELIDDSRLAIVGYVPGTAQTVQRRLQFSADGNNEFSDALGEWSVDLVPNAWIEPLGTLYRVTEQRGRTLESVHIIEVPEDDGPYTVIEVLVNLPGSSGSQLLSHLSDEEAAHTAAAVSFEPAGNLVATDVQAALVELDAQDTAEAGARAAADTAEATTRAAADTTLTTNLAAETAARIAADSTLSTAVAAHPADAADAHDASAISVAAIAGLAATDVQAALAEHQFDITTEVAARTADVDAEQTRAAAAEGVLATDLATLDGVVTDLGTDLADETAARVAADSAEATARANADTAEATTRAAADTAATAALASHAAATAAHGIANTANLVLTSDARLSDTRIPTDNSVTQAKVQAGSLGIDRLAVDPRARATHSGTQTADTISDLTTAVRANRLDQMAAPTGPLSVNGQRVTNGTLPVAGTDLITKDYADALRSGLLLKADPVRVMVDANVNINAPGAVLDGVTLTAGVDSLLLTGQTSGNDNGLYLYNGPAVPLTRRSDANTSEEMRSGTAVWVTAGTYDDQRWALVTPDPITLGVTAQSWAFDGGLAHVAAGAGLTKTGNTIDVGEGTGLEVLADSVGIADGGVDTDQLADDAVTTAKLAPDAVDTAAIVDLNVTTAKLADEAVTTAKLADDAVTAAKLADNAVDTAAIADGAVALAKLGFDVATQAELEAAVDALELALAMKLGAHWVPAPTGGETTTQQRVRIQAAIDAWALTGGVLGFEPALYQTDGPLYLPEDPPAEGSVFHTWMIWAFGARIQGMPTGTAWAPWFVVDDVLPVARTYLGNPQTAISRLIARAGRKFTIKGLELSGPGTGPGTNLGTVDSVTFVTATPGAAGAITGTYRYQVSYIDAAGNETPGGPFSLKATAAAQQIDLTGIAPGPAGTTHRKVYRSKAIVQTSTNGAIQGSVNIAEICYLLTTIADNVTTTYTDNNGDDGTLGAQCPTIGGLRVYGSYQLRTEQCNSEYLNTDVDLILGLEADVDGWQSYSPYNYSVRLRSAQNLVTGATHGNSAGNIAKVRNFRCYGANNTLAHIDIIGVNEVALEQIVTEGYTPECAIRFNRDQSVNTQRFNVRHWHPEFAGGAPRDAELKVLGGSCRIVMEDVSFTTPNATLVSVSESLGGASVEIDRITFTAVGAKFDNGASTADWTIRGAGSATATIAWADASRWIGGLVPASLKVERWSSSGAPDNMGGTHPVDVYSRYLLQSLTDIIIRTSIADPQFGVKIEGAVQQRSQNGALHPDFLGGAGVLGAHYFTISKDEALKQYRVWGKDSTGAVIHASLPYGGDASGTAAKNGYTGLVRRTVAPVSADLLASEAVPWFDSTNATPALVWYAKSADGTIRTQRIELTGGHGAERYASLGNLGAAPVLNIANGTVQQGTFNTNAAFAAFTAPPVAASYAWKFRFYARQDGTGGRTATWHASVKWAGDTPPALADPAGRATILEFETYDGGTSWYGSVVAVNVP